MSEIITSKDSERVLVGKQNYECLNEVKLTGAVVHIFAPEGRDVVVLTIATSAGRSGKSNYPKVTWYDERAKAIRAELKISENNYPRVCIKATIQTKKKGEGKDAVYYQTIVGTELSYAPRYLEGKLNMDIGSRYIEDENEVLLLGEVVHLFHFGANKSGNGKPTGSIITVKTKLTNWANFPKVTLFKQLCQKAQQMNEGEIVAVTGIIQTNKDVRDQQRPEYYETVVGTDLDWYRV